MIKFVQLVTVLSTLCALSWGLPSSTRVVGGQDARTGSFPYQVSLLKKDSHTCGGSIISERHILTAAHCVVIGGGIQPYPARDFSVRVGSSNRAAGGVMHNVKTITVNDEYGSFLNDVAILELVEPIVFNNQTQPIALQQDELPPGTRVIISGWGRLQTGGIIPYRLQYNTLTTISDEECDERIGWGYPSLMCLDHAAGNGACNGDSGGPAAWNNRLVGVAGFVYGGCGSSNPDGYAKVAHFYDWIVANSK